MCLKFAALRQREKFPRYQRFEVKIGSRFGPGTCSATARGRGFERLIREVGIILLQLPGYFESLGALVANCSSWGFAGRALWILA